MSASADRLFLAVPLSPAVRAELEDHLRRWAPGGLPGRAVPPENWHLTLRFLGDTEEPVARALRDELSAADLGHRFSLRFGTCGAFPRPERAKVVWLGAAEGVEPLRHLARVAEAAARRVGFAAENRPFTPHLTLSRTRAPQDVRALLESIPPFPEPLPVHEVVLYRSHPGGGPPRYEAVDSYGLG